MKVALHRSILTAEAESSMANHIVDIMNEFVLVRNEDISSVIHADPEVSHVLRLDKLTLVKLSVTGRLRIKS